MDGVLSPLTQDKQKRKGSAKFALPFVLVTLLSAGLSAAAAGFTETEDPHLDAGARVLFIKPVAFDTLASNLGYPTVGSPLLLWGGGATLAPGLLRVQMSGWAGGLSAVQGTRTSTWDLHLAAITLEQRYPLGQFLVTAGSSFELGELRGALDDGATLNRVQAPLWGAGVSVGGRWPAKTKLGFFARAGYLWLQGSGDWRGPLAPTLGTGHFDLGGLNGTVQVELSL